ncbi:MAG: ATP-dependent DNA helicase [Haliea sp.]|nr:MAG: ATP-dependent DNA helicase [Haliea sp.]
MRPASRCRRQQRWVYRPRRKRLRCRKHPLRHTRPAEPTSGSPGHRLKYLVAVRALCEFTAKAGDLDLRFTPSPTAQEGIAGHALVASRRDADYESEVTLTGDYKSITVRGRADGYDPTHNQLEEVKTFRGDLHHMPDNHRALHWAQVKVYGWLLCRQRGLQEINLALVYFDIASLQETVLVERFDAHALREFFELQCERFLVWAEREMAHRSARDAGLTALVFPHAGFRPGQRELAEAVYRTASAGRCLLAQAPTGIGKTIGTVFPLLKAAPGQLDKLFFLAAKTPGRRLALDALARLRQGDAGADTAEGIAEAIAPANTDAVVLPARALAISRPVLPLRVLELVAREKSCEHPDKACHGDSCPLAQGFYDRLPAARSAAMDRADRGALLDRAALRDVALAHHICPYYLSQDLVRWSDAVVGDYNYFFDTSALLYSLTVNNQWRVSVLVDEAHNMVERARKMYSATLDQTALHDLHSTGPRAVRGVLERLNRAWNELHQTQVEEYRLHKDIPASFLKALQNTIAQITDFLLANPTRMDAALQDFYFEALHFSRMAEAFGAHALFDITFPDPSRGNALQAGLEASVLCIRNVVPAPFLTPRFAAAKSVTLFSATLSPADFYVETLGLPPATPWIDVQSPFLAGQLEVHAVRNISTRWRHRDDSLPAITQLMARQYDRRPGNYLAFVSSYDYLQKLAQLFRQRHPQIPVWEQTRNMDEAGRVQFLARFRPDSQGIGFAVLGGPFAEGVDLPGKRLIGAFIATLGMPQFNPVNEAIRERMGTYFDRDASTALARREIEGRPPEDAASADPSSSDRRQRRESPDARQAAAERGYNYTYLYPGLQKVVQAAGRVIRTPSDDGVVYLMDDRFTRPDVLALLPGWWTVGRLRAGQPGRATPALPQPLMPLG